MTNAVHPTPEDGKEAHDLTMAEVHEGAKRKGIGIDWFWTRIKQAGNAKKDPFSSFDEKKQQKVTKRFADHHVRLKATEMAGKTLGIISEKHKMEVEGMVYLSPEPIKTPKGAGK